MQEYNVANNGIDKNSRKHHFANGVSGTYSISRKAQKFAKSNSIENLSIDKLVGGVEEEYPGLENFQKLLVRAREKTIGDSV